jgi:hypothetical protein
MLKHSCTVEMYGLNFLTNDYYYNEGFLPLSYKYLSLECGKSFR